MATAPDPAPAKRIEELLTCDICREILNEPKTLPCFHSFCKICLARYIEVQREKTQRLRTVQHLYHCPVCRTQFELKRDNMEEIPPSFFINNLLEILPVIQLQTQKLHCGSCKVQVSVTSRCIECERYLCETCLTTHNNWPDFRNHVVMTLEDLEKPENQSKAKGKPRCQKPGHGSKSFEFYCDKCKELVCITCILLNHPRPDHSYRPTDIVAEEHKRALMTTAGILQKTSRDVQIALQKINNATQRLQANAKRAKEMIQEQEQEIAQALAKKVKSEAGVLLGQVDTQNSGVNEKLEKQHDEMNSYHERVNGSLNFAKNIMETANSEEIILLGKQVLVNANDIKNEYPETMGPIHDGDIEYQANSTKTIVGNVKLDDLGIVSRSS